MKSNDGGGGGGGGEGRKYFRQETAPTNFATDLALPQVLLEYTVIIFTCVSLDMYILD